MSGKGNGALGELSDENQRLRDLIQQRNHEIVRLTTELRSQPIGFDAASSRERTATAQPRYWSPDEHERFLQVGRIAEPRILPLFLGMALTIQKSCALALHRG